MPKSNTKQSSSSSKPKNTRTHSVEAAKEMTPSKTARGKKGGATTKKLVAKGKQSLDTKAMKYEIADELGVELGGNATARQNGKVGGAITRACASKGRSRSSSSNTR